MYIICKYKIHLYICINFRNSSRVKIGHLRAFPSCFEMSTNNKLISGHCRNVRHVCKSCPIYTLKGKTLGIVVDFPQSNVYSAVYARPVSLTLRPTYDSDYACV